MDYFKFNELLAKIIKGYVPTFEEYHDAYQYVYDEESDEIKMSYPSWMNKIPKGLPIEETIRISKMIDNIYAFKLRYNVIQKFNIEENYK